MTGIFMFLLFLLNIITILAVVVLFMRQNRLIQAEKDQKAIVAEMEELMSGFMMEMKEENEALLEKLSKKKQRTTNKNVEEPLNLEETKSPVQELNHIDDQNPPQFSKTPKQQAVKAYKNQFKPITVGNEENQAEDTVLVELSLESETDEQHQKKNTFKDTLQASLNGSAEQEPSFYEQVYSLAKQGLSAEEIAQQLKCGKTEVELILKFQTNL